ncbi:MAG: hypothetical protein KJ060_11525, partial [Candidatus Hydrogenedentes bacterium]|nr:hypothetical protein [Candidatus Hydrogenedentota bacterium]
GISGAVGTGAGCVTGGVSFAAVGVDGSELGVSGFGDVAALRSRRGGGAGMYFAFDSLRFAGEPDPPADATVSPDSGGNLTGRGATCLPSPWEAAVPAGTRSGISADSEFDATGAELVSPVNR